MNPDKSLCIDSELNKIESRGIINKGPWYQREDDQLREWIRLNGELSLNSNFAQIIVPSRSVKQCKARWNKVLCPDIKKKEWGEEEEYLIFKYVKILGFKWKQISEYLERRTDTSVKNMFNSSFRSFIKSKRLDKSNIQNHLKEFLQSEFSIKIQKIDEMLKQANRDFYVGLRHTELVKILGEISRQKDMVAEPSLILNFHENALQGISTVNSTNSYGMQVFNTESQLNFSKCLIRPSLPFCQVSLDLNEETNCDNILIKLNHLQSELQQFENEIFDIS